MSPRDPDDIIRAWFHEGPSKGTANGLEQTLSKLATTRQGIRREVRLPLWIPAAAVLSLVLVITVAFGAGFRIVPPGPDRSPGPSISATTNDCRLELPVHGRDAVLFGIGFAPETDVVLEIDRASGAHLTIDRSGGAPRTDRTGGFYMPLRPYPEDDLGRGRITAIAGCTATIETVVTEADLPTPCPDPTTPSTPLVDGPAYRAAVAADQPFAWWRLDDTGGTAVDSAGGGHDGTYLGNMEHSVLTPLSDGGAAFFHHQFPAPDTFVGFEPIVLSGDFSIEFWMDFCHWADGDAILGSPDSPASLLIGEGELSLSAGFDGVIWAGEPIISGVWQHFVVLRAGDDLAIYRNGEVDDFSSDNGWTDDFTVSQIGKGVYDNYLGFLDEVALYDHALPPERIAAHADP